MSYATQMKVIKGSGIAQPKKCSVCNGSGEVENNGPKPCTKCGGNGYIDPDWFYPKLVKCPTPS